jgi:hypothetical protein
MCIAQGMALLDVTIVNTVLPSIERELTNATSPKTSCVNLSCEVADGGLLSSAARSARAGRPLGDSGAGHPLGGGEVGHGARWCGDGDGDVALQRSVS